jgi:hypothetical protein
MQDTRQLRPNGFGFNLQSTRLKWVSKVFQGAAMTATARAVAKADANCSDSLPLNLQSTNAGQRVVKSEHAHGSSSTHKKQQLVRTGRQRQDRKQLPRLNYGKCWNTGTARDAHHISM